MPQNTNDVFSVYSKDMFDGVFEMTKEDIQSNGRQMQINNSNFINVTRKCDTAMQNSSLETISNGTLNTLEFD